MFNILKRLIGSDFHLPEPDTFWRNEGLPPKDIKWDDGEKYGGHGLEPPKHCPTCSVEAEEVKSDYWKFEDDTGQFMVITRYCPNGHGFSVWLA